MNAQTIIARESTFSWSDGSVSSFEQPVWVIYPDGGRPWSTDHVQDTEEQAIAALFPSYAWPGGYDIAYFDHDGSVLCANCARDEYRGNGCNDAGYVCAGHVVEEQADNDLTCDQCNAVIAKQDWCSVHSQWESYPVCGDPERPNIVTEMRDACPVCNPELFADDEN